MGLGSTAKKVQKVADIAEELYTRINEMREQMRGLQNTVEDTGERVQTLERELDEQRALLEALAEEQGIDPGAVLTDALIEDADAAAGNVDADEAPADSPSTDTPAAED